MTLLLGYLLRIFILMVTFLALSSCGTTSHELRPFVRDFEDRMGVGVEYIVHFSSALEVINKVTGRTIIGVCSTIPFVKAFSVKINADRWKYLSYNRKRVLVFHENLHCALNKWHDERVFTDGCPVSIMHPYLVSDYCINKHGIEYYLNSVK